jgi:hypothetical protein
MVSPKEIRGWELLSGYLGNREEVIINKSIN